jgi:hypothetical protein
VFGKSLDKSSEICEWAEGVTYEKKVKEPGLTILEELRHGLDMIQIYKIVTGKERVRSDTRFQTACDSFRVTRSSAGPLNLRPTTVRLEIIRNFCSQGVQTDWNKILTETKMANNAEREVQLKSLTGWSYPRRRTLRMENGEERTTRWTDPLAAHQGHGESSINYSSK